MVFVDESGFSLIPYIAKTWAPVGHTPVLGTPGPLAQVLGDQWGHPTGEAFLPNVLGFDR